MSYDSTISADAAIAAMNGFQVSLFIEYSLFFLQIPLFVDMYLQIGSKRLKVQHKRTGQSTDFYYQPNSNVFPSTFNQYQGLVHDFISLPMQQQESQAKSVDDLEHAVANMRF